VYYRNKTNKLAGYEKYQEFKNSTVKKSIGSKEKKQYI